MGPDCGHWMGQRAQAGFHPCDVQWGVPPDGQHCEP